MLTKRQKQILDYIKQFIRHKGYAPTFEELRRHFKLVSKSTVHGHIKALELKGYIKRLNHKSRAIEIIRKDNTKLISIPFLGTIAAGQPIEAIENKETIAVAKKRLPESGDVYALRVTGNSMIDENINDGDVILVKHQKVADNGEKVVALIDNDSATLKKFYKENNHIRLQPANKKFKAIIIEKDRDFAIQGVVIDIIKNIAPQSMDITAKTTNYSKKTEKINKIFESDNFNEIKKKLGEPYFEIDNCLIYNLESLEAMKAIKAPFVDLTITSPPYNIGKEYEKNMPIDSYVNWCQKWMEEIHRITKNSGTFWLNLGYLELPNKAKALPITYLLWDKSPFYLIQEVIWNYGAGVAAKNFLSPRNEKLLWYVKNLNSYIFNLDDVRDKNVKYPNQRKNGKLRCNPLGKNPSDVWQIPKVTSGKNRSSKERTSHPAQFPETLIERIVKASSNKKQIIFDPFLGSGTSAIIALKNNRKFVGIELSKDYCKIAKERILDYLKTEEQLRLFNRI